MVGAETTVWCRLAAVCTGEEWQETHLEVTSGAAPPAWEPRSWDYDEAIFRSFEADGPTVAGWLRAVAIAVNDIVVSLPRATGNTVQWQKRSSRQAYGGFDALQRPMT